MQPSLVAALSVAPRLFVRPSVCASLMLIFDVKTSCRQVNDLFEVIEFGFFEVSEFSHYKACYHQC